MSLDVLSNLSKEIVSKKATSTDSKEDVSSKKEGSSLFDSLMKGIQKEKQPDITDKPQKETTKNETNEKKVVVDSKLNQAQENEGTKEASKKVSEGLVDLVVDKAKLKSQQELLPEKTAKNTKTTEEIKTVETKTAESKTNEEIKIKVDGKASLIKEAVDEIKNEISKIGKEDKENSKELEKSKTDKNNTAKTTEEIKTVESKTNEEIKIKVDGKASLIKEAVDEIKNEISKIGKEDKENSKELEKSKTDKNNTAKTTETTETTEESKTNEEIKIKVDGKASLIKEAVDEIKNEISKIGKEDKENSKELEKSKTDKNNTAKTTEEIKTVESKTNEEIKIKVDGKASLIKEAVDEIKKDISSIENNEENGTLDSLTKNNNEGNGKETTKSSIAKQQVLENELFSKKTETQIDGKITLLANGFLNSQEKNKQTVSLSQLSNAQNNIEKNKTLKSVKDSANMLDLNMEKINVEHSDESGKAKTIEVLSKEDKASQLQRIQNQGVNRFIMEKENMVKNEELINSAEIDKTSSDNVQQKEKNILLNVPQAVVETIQSKIIGAQQKVGSFMSEVARNMYLNYKPPFTSFRMNLNPANLGSIAVVMRASKTDNNISVSMNMNNNSTMEVMAENKVALQTALQKQLGDGSNVSLSFDMQDGSNTDQFEQSNQNNNSSNQNNRDNRPEESTKVVLEDENIEELDYM